ncbi:hypothetical protein ACWE42_21225 [Sutcliffiella cohnii]
MKILVTAKEKRLLDHYYKLMNDTSLPLSQRRVAKIRFDNLYNEAKLRACNTDTTLYG